MTGRILAASAATTAVVHVVAVVAGVVVVGGVLVSGLETVVLPRDGFTRIARATFAVADRLLVHRWRSEKRRDNLRALYGPVALVSLPLVWMISVLLGFTLVFWGIRSGTWQRSFEVSGSSLTTLGFAAPEGSVRTWVTFVEAIIGLGLVALLISYLPTIYAAHHERERGITTLRPFAGAPADPVAMLANLAQLHTLDSTDFWRTAAAWLMQLDQTHRAFPALCYFPESADGQSWVASVGSLLDTTALVLSTDDIGARMSRARGNQGPLLVLAHGTPAIARIGRAAGLPLDPPVDLLALVARTAEEPPDISVTRQEYLTALDRLGAVLVVADGDREAAWRRFAWIRSSYDRGLRGLAGLTAAVPAPWTTDRPARVGRPRLVTNRPIRTDWRVPAERSGTPARDPGPG